MKQEKDKKIKCPLCENTFDRIDMKEQTTDIFLGLNWGVPSWEVIELCPYCGYSALTNPLKNNKEGLLALREQWHSCYK